MQPSQPKKPIGKRILIGLLIFFIVAGITAHLLVTYYLSPLLRERLTAIIVNGSDSLYRVEMGKFDLRFWRGSADFENINITIDSNVYRKMKGSQRLPALSVELKLQRGRIKGIGLRSLFFSKRMKIREIVFDSADVQLVRHYKNSSDSISSGLPLWKQIQPRLRSITIDRLMASSITINYRNSDSATAYRWQIEKSRVNAFDIKVDSASAHDSSRILFAGNISLDAGSIKLNTADGLYALQTGEVAYSTGAKKLQIKEFSFLPQATSPQFAQHFGYAHEIYQLTIPFAEVNDFLLAKWITDNRLQTGVVELRSPVIKVSLDRNEKPNPYSRKGNYPHQLLQKAGFMIDVKKLIAQDARVSYTEISNLTNKTGVVSFSSLQGTIDNITNDPALIRQNPSCVAVINGAVMQRGSLSTVFRFDLANRSGGFSVKATISKLDAPQLRPLFSAMTAVDLQSFNMQRLDYAISGNDDKATGSLSMHYNEMDILINKVEADRSLDKKGFLSFLANRVLIYKENPMNDEGERKANGVILQREATRSFFNLVWRTMFASAGEIVLRPMAKNRIENRKARETRRAERKLERKARQAEKLTSPAAN